VSDRPPADLNERVTDAWTTETSPAERVRTVMKRTYERHSVASIAERARTSETTARKHLKVLTEDGFVEAVSPPDGRGTWYRRAPRSVVLERARQLLDSVDTETLSTSVAELRESVRAFEDETGAESPEAAALTDEEIDAEVITQWQTTRRNLKLARAALALADATEAIEDETDTSGYGDLDGVTG
jgi:DNA-binding transcriptional ArsR family regulator